MTKEKKSLEELIAEDEAAKKEIEKLSPGKMFTTLKHLEDVLSKDHVSIIGHVNLKEGILEAIRSAITPENPKPLSEIVEEYHPSWFKDMEERKERAKNLYNEYVDDHDTIHSNRFPAWWELSESEKQKWLDQVKV